MPYLFGLRNQFNEVCYVPCESRAADGKPHVVPVRLGEMQATVYGPSGPNRQSKEIPVTIFKKEDGTFAVTTVGLVSDHFRAEAEPAPNEPADDDVETCATCGRKVKVQKEPAPAAASASQPSVEAIRSVEPRSLDHSWAAAMQKVNDEFGVSVPSATTSTRSAPAG